MGVFILVDYQNQPVDLSLVVEKCSEFGRVVGGKAYGHWVRYPVTLISFHKIGFELIELPEDGFSHKNSNDIKMAVDAMEVMFTIPHIDTFVLVSGDMDFAPLVKKLRVYNKKVILISRKGNTAKLLTDLADSYIPYEEIVKNEKISVDNDIETLLDEVRNIVKSNTNGAIDEKTMHRILSSMKIDPKKYSFDNFPQMCNFFVRKLSEDSKNVYEEGYKRFIERLVSLSDEMFDATSLKEACMKRVPWISKNSTRNITLEQLIKEMISQKRLEIDKNGYVSVPAPRRWQIKLQDVQPYPEFRNEFIERAYEFFEDGSLKTISEVVRLVREEMKVSGKIASSFAYALKFTGCFFDENGADYVSLNTPVRINCSVEELKKRVDAFYVKRVLRLEPLSMNDLGKLSEFIYGNQDNNIEGVMNFLVENSDASFENGTFFYRKNLDALMDRNVN